MEDAKKEADAREAKRIEEQRIKNEEETAKKLRELQDKLDKEAGRKTQTEFEEEERNRKEEFLKNHPKTFEELKAKPGLGPDYSSSTPTLTPTFEKGADK
jgi:hypothetical protein